MPKFKFQPNKDIDHAGVTNGHRAAKAEAACRQATLTRPATSSDPTEDYFVSDLLTDCFHLCDREGWDVDAVLAKARRQWEDER